ARVVARAGSGRIFAANDSESLAEELVWMYQHENDVEQMGRNGRIAALGEFSWRHDARRLLDMYSDMDSRFGRVAPPADSGTY
ncbi:MAG: glycosyltransferase, partial [Spirochaetales bacterium]|nr:glycosyltransferase [Spirochaetales bacterium]